MRVPRFEHRAGGQVSCAIDAGMTPPPERRPKWRRPAQRTGVVVFLGDTGKFNCTICDISGSGACIAVPKNVTVPEHFFLIDILSRVVYVATVVWHRDLQFGIAFALSFPLTKLKDPALLFLKRRWLEQAVR